MLLKLFSKAIEMIASAIYASTANSGLATFVARFASDLIVGFESFTFALKSFMATSDTTMSMHMETKKISAPELLFIN